MTEPSNPLASERGVSRWLVAAILLVLAGGGVMYFVTRPRSGVEVQPASGIQSLAGSILSGPEARFTWSKDRRADVYRLEVYDLASHLLGAAVLRDTSILASAVLPDTAHAGIWRVVPVSVGGTELPPTPNSRFTRP